MEKGQASSPLLAKENTTDINHLDQLKNSSSLPSSSDTACTPAIVLSTLVAICGSYVYGSAVGFSSPAEAGIISDLGLTLAEYSVFGSILSIGGMAGAVISGRIAYTFGRRITMGISQLLSLLGWFTIGFAKVAWLLDLGRLSVGFGIGLLSYVVPVYIAEITPKNLRGGFTAAHQLVLCVGVSVMWLIGIVVHWRILALIGTIPCVIQLLGLFFIPESPRWLAEKGQWKDCERSLRRLRGQNADIAYEALQIREYTETVHCLSKATFFDIFQWRYAHSLIVGIGLMILQQFQGIAGVVYYADSVFESTGLSAISGTVAMIAVKLPMTAISMVLTDKSGRRPLLMVSAAGTCLGCILLGLTFLIQDLHTGSEIAPLLALAGILIYIACFSSGMGGIPWIIMSEIFPINVKDSAGSLVTVINWLSSLIISYNFNFLMAWSSAGTFFAFAVICGITMVFVMVLVPETKGRTLEEIQASLNHFNLNQ